MSCRKKNPNPKPRVTAEVSREKRAGGEIPPSQLPPSALPFRKVFQECEHGQTHPRNEIPLLRAWVFSKLRLLWVCKREEHELHSSHPWDAPGGLLPHSLHTCTCSFLGFPLQSQQKCIFMASKKFPSHGETRSAVGCCQLSCK